MRNRLWLILVLLLVVVAILWYAPWPDPTPTESTGAPSEDVEPPPRTAPRSQSPHARTRDHAAPERPHSLAIPDGILEDPVFRSGLGDVRGRVVDPHGRPLPGLRVVWRSLSAGTVEPVRAWEEASSTSGQDGRFVLTGVEPFVPPHLTVGEGSPWVFQTALKDHPTYKALVAHPSDTIDLGDVVVEHRCGITGIVTGPDGAPCAGAHVTATTVRPDVWPASGHHRFDFLEGDSAAVQEWRDAPVIQTRTGTEGRYLIEALKPGRIEITVQVPGGFVPFDASFNLPAQGVPGVVTDIGTLRRPPGRTVRCRVADTDGRPVRDAEVAVAVPLQELPGDDRKRYLTVRMGPPDATGVFAIRGYPKKELTLAARRPGQSWTVVPRVPAATITTIRLAASPEMHVRVSDSEGRAVSKPRIRLFALRETARRLGLSLTSGELALAGRMKNTGIGACLVSALARGTYELRATDATGKLVCVQAVDLQESMRVEATIGPAKTLRVHVVDGQDRRLPFARVRDGDQLVGWTDANGELAMDVTGDTSVELEVSHPAFRGGRQATLHLPQSTVRIQLHRHCVVEGRVTVPRGNPVFENWDIGIGGFPSLKLDGRGRFYVVFDAPGVHPIEYLVDGSRRWLAFDIRGQAGKDLEVPEGKKSVVLLADWSAPEPNAWLRGAVTLDGRPMVHVRVENETADKMERKSTTTGPGGAFELGPVYGDEVKLRVTGEQESTRLMRRAVWWEGVLKTGDAPLPELRIDIGTGRLSGSVVDPKGKPVPNQLVWVVGKLDGGGITKRAAARFATRTGHDGQFSFPRLTAGVYRAHVRTGRKVWGWTPVARDSSDTRLIGVTEGIEVGRTKPIAGIVVNLQRSVSARGRLDISDLGVQGVRVTSLRFVGPIESEAPVENGRFAMRDLLPGDYAVSLYLGEGNGIEIRHALPVHVGDAGTADLEIGFDSSYLAVLRRTAKTRGFSTLGEYLEKHDLQLAKSGQRKK